MSKATDTRIPVSTETRRELRILKAERDYGSYDELLQSLVQEQGGVHR